MITLRSNESLVIEIEALKNVIAAHELIDGYTGSQSKVESRVEVTANYLSGFLLAWFTMTWVVTPLVTLGVMHWDNAFAVTTIFTVVSILRSYYWRRFFAKNLHKVVHNIIKGYFK